MSPVASRGDTQPHAEPEDADEVLWDDNNVQYTEEEWRKRFGESDDEGDSHNDFEGFYLFLRTLR